jgi:acetylornithine deacetylase/succinyl-diaminopimelate desuccinylase family protein
MSDVIGTLADLVRIRSTNPAYDGGVPEAAVAAYIREFFAARGIAAEAQEVLPGRPNLLARLPGSEPGRRIVLEAHMDTAGVAGMAGDPFDPEIRDGRMYGRGSCDTKAGLAAMMHAMASVKADGIVPRCEVLLAAAIDEEFSFQGVLRLRDGLSADAAIVAEPTSLRLVSATKGVLRFRVRTTGKAAHSSKPHLGVNAVYHMARVVTALEEHAALLDESTHPLLGPATFCTGIIQGGTQVNIVPEACLIEIDRRLIPGELPRQVWHEYRAFLQSLSQRIPGLRVEADLPMLEDLPLETASSQAAVAVASRVLGELGLDPAPAGVPYGSDASKLSAVGIPSIVFGPGSIDQAHAAVEYVDCDQVRLAEQFFRRFILSF